MSNSFVTLWTVASQAPLSMGFSRQEYWSGLPCPPAGDLPYSGIELPTLKSPVLANSFFTTSATWEAISYRDIILHINYAAAVWILIFWSLSVTCLLGKCICMYNNFWLKFQISNIWCDFAKEHIFKEFRYDQIQVVPTRMTKKKKKCMEISLAIGV